MNIKIGKTMNVTQWIGSPAAEVPWFFVVFWLNLNVFRGITKNNVVTKIFYFF